MEASPAMSKTSHKEKVEFMKKNGLCFACSIKGHMSKTCKKRLTCCSFEEKHPTVLHIENSIPEGTAGNIRMSMSAKKDAIIQSNPVTIAIVSTEHTGNRSQIGS